MQSVWPNTMVQAGSGKRPIAVEIASWLEEMAAVWEPLPADLREIARQMECDAGKFTCTRSAIVQAQSPWWQYLKRYYSAVTQSATEKDQLMTLNIRDAVLQDEPEVIRLWQRCDLVTSYNDPGSDFRFACAGNASIALVGMEEERIIGTVMVGHDGHRGWLYYVACSPDWQSTGIGREMVGLGEDWLRTRGVVKVHLMVRETNMQATRFYERLGFEIMPRIALSKWLNREAPLVSRPSRKR